MNMKSFFSLLLAGLVSAAPAVTPVERGLASVEARDNSIEARQATRVQFTSITASGAGCPSGTWSTVISPGQDVGTIAFNQYSVVTTTSRACTVTIRLTYPGGCTYGNFEGTTHGFALVDSGVSGSYSTSYTSTTGNNANPPNSVFSGPSWAGGNTFTKSDVAPAKVVNRSPNNAQVTVTVNTSLGLSRANGGAITTNDITFRITNQSRNSNWQTCV
ncbi:uncharacterized protein DNG_03356 [Cephalotrichum gorgonifer]|uniref:Secreted protein n=1 Tax=Cephalotrichum gorgonifer TaxID=2041049 RepID=A0AAE8MWC6_9PEZI|nr:uncharacterized protein DNG_03356 [Cephalotrichum gorgonifer]